jgi:dTDP-4-dehydrorhamnose 3,5-epimerase
MIFRETKIAGVIEIDLEIRADERGFFARSWCRREFEARGLDSNLVQCNVSYNKRRGTLRGMHYQQEPHAECKLVRCTRGAIYDVVVDLRRNSHTFGQWSSLTLTAENRHMIFVPEGCAHGFLTLDDDVEVFYQMSEFYEPKAARGVRFDDPQFRIEWPEPVKVISERDRNYPSFE